MSSFPPECSTTESPLDEALARAQENPNDFKALRTLREAFTPMLRGGGHAKIPAGTVGAILELLSETTEPYAIVVTLLEDLNLLFTTRGDLGFLSGQHTALLTRARAAQAVIQAST